MKCIAGHIQLALIFLLPVCAANVRAQTISTIAGPGNAVYSSSDTTFEMLTNLTNPSSIAADDSGNLYIAAYWDAGDLNSSIFRLSLAGRLLSMETAIHGGEHARHLSYAHGIAVSAEGDIYVSEYRAHMLRKVTADGRLVQVTGESGPGYGGDDLPATLATVGLPNGVATDRLGNVYFADELNNVVRKIDADGIITRFAGTGDERYIGDGGPAIRAGLSKPFGVAVDHNGNVFVADAGHHVIRKVTAAGIITTIAGNGTTGNDGDGGMATAAHMNSPAGIAVDGQGDVFFADEEANLVREIKKDGTILTVAGTGSKGYSGDGGAATAAALSSPRDVAVDRFGNLYIVDFGNHVVRKVVLPSIPEASDKVTLAVSEDNELIINTETDSYKSLVIGSMAGEAVMTQPITGRQTRVNISGLQPGYYEITLKKDDGGTRVLRFVKSN